MRGEVSVLTWSGEIDLSSVPGLHTQVDTALQESPDTLVIDLSGVTFLDSTGLGTLVWVHSRCRERNTRLVIRDVPPNVTRLLKITALNQVLTIE